MQSTFRKTCSHSACKEYYFYVIRYVVGVFIKKPANGQYPGPVESSIYFYILFLYDIFYIICLSTRRYRKCWVNCNSFEFYSYFIFSNAGFDAVYRDGFFVALSLFRPMFECCLKLAPSKIISNLLYTIYTM